MYTYGSLLREGERRLAEEGIGEAKTDAWLLFSAASGFTRTEYFMRERETASARIVEEYSEKIRRRAKREPVQYIEGTAPFMGYDFYVNEDVLIPRMDTEILVDEALFIARRLCKDMEKLRILDMCTGSGCIIISLYRILKDEGRVLFTAASDVSERALFVAEQNAQRLRADIRFFQGDLFEKVEGEYDMIVSNPPYIRTDVIDGLSLEVREHEPHLALDGSEDGLYFYREITKQAQKHLCAGGYLLFEIGCDQGQEVFTICRTAGYNNIKIIKDYAGLDRVIAAQKG